MLLATEARRAVARIKGEGGSHKMDTASVGHWQAPLVVTQSSLWTLAVRLRPGALTQDYFRRGAMMVLQRGFQSRLRGFDSRPRHYYGPV